MRLPPWMDGWMDIQQGCSTSVLHPCCISIRLGWMDIPQGCSTTSTMTCGCDQKISHPASSWIINMIPIISESMGWLGDQTTQGPPEGVPGACGEITDDGRNLFDGLSSTITHRGVKREILRGRRTAKEELLRQQTKHSATGGCIASTDGCYVSTGVDGWIDSRGAARRVRRPRLS